MSACASGGDAIGQGQALLRMGVADAVIAGGTEAAICPIGVAGFNSVKALSRRNDDPQKASRPFDAGRDGFVLGEGAGILVMETLENARERGSGADRGDGRVRVDVGRSPHHAASSRRGGAARAMEMALKDAGMAPEDIDYINAHGTSTPLNDRSETLAMKRVFGDEAYKIPISSTKSMTGHLLGASGALEAAVAAMAIANSAAPPTINLEEPDPDCDLDYIPHVARRGRIRTAMSNSFGFGGHNVSLIFKEFTG